MMIKFKWQTILEWYSFIATIAIVGLVLHDSHGTIVSLRIQLVEVFIVFGLIIVLSLAWSGCSWLAANAIEHFRDKKNKALKEPADSTAPRINLYLDKVEGGAVANGEIEGTLKDKTVMLSFLIMKVAKGDEKILVSLLLDIIKLSKEMFKYDKAKERKHD